MSRFLFLFALALGMLTAQPNPGELFSQQAEVFVDSAGLSRLELPNEVLTRVAADLSDLRLFDAQGNEVPYSIESGQSYANAQNEFSPTVTALDRSTEEAERGQNTYRETYRLELPADVSLAGGWRLQLRSGAPEFVRRVSVDAIAPGERSALLQGAPYFRVQDSRAEKVDFELPHFPNHVIEVTIEGQGGSYLTPRFTLYQGRTRAPRTASETQLTVVQRTEERGKTTLEIELPRALVPTALSFATSTATFVREVHVLDPTTSLSAQSVIFHVPAAVPIEQLDAAVKTARGDRLTVLIINQDSPPLQNLSITAIALQPALLFSMPPVESDAAAGTLRFGGGRTKKPNYDLVALEAVMQNETARGVSLEAPAPARLGPIAANPNYAPKTLLSFASRPGAEIDAGNYSHMLPALLEPSDEGLTRIELSVQDAAVTGPDFADVRLADSNNAQWAYLLDRDARQEWLPLTVSSPASEDGATRYRLTLPASVAQIDRIRLDFAGAYFDRTYQLIAEVDGQEHYLASDRLSASGGDDAPIEIEFAAVRATELTLTVFDGNDQPLPAPAVEGRFPLPDLYTVAPAGNYKLLLGFPDDRPPVYELEQASSTVLAARAGSATLGEVIENPSFSASSRLRTGPGTQKALFWIALLAGVGVLAVMTLKTVRGEAGDAS